ncbi:c-type cytochrome [Paraburkholderia adhaesiva]|uniref:c-type cytochrome n=1 Tax=Paraburkholderia adhaesiva TaxID=2883244 RepID=UPI001F39B3E2|nr:c-type cytochrome [Paraburkholderia adhaesiva]
MKEERLFSLRNPWFVVSAGGTALVAVLSILVGFVWLPSVHSDFTANGLWGAICSAAGAPSSWYKGGDNVADAPPSNVVVLPPLGIARVDVVSSGRGATLATQRCSMCHGVQSPAGVTAPFLAGQYADVIYKELRDFQNGARQNAIMQPIIASLSDQDMHDVAQYYSSQPRVVQATAADGHDDSVARVLTMQGAPIRNIAPCAACHGVLDRKGAAPWLGGQAAPYLAAQLRLFAAGDRHNDIDEQMRNVARQLRPEEIDSLAKYYAAQP